MDPNDPLRSPEPSGPLHPKPIQFVDDLVDITAPTNTNKHSNPSTTTTRRLSPSTPSSSNRHIQTPLDSSTCSSSKAFLKSPVTTYSAAQDPMSLNNGSTAQGLQTPSDSIQPKTSSTLFAETPSRILHKAQAPATLALSSSPNATPIGVARGNSEQQGASSDPKAFRSRASSLSPSVTSLADQRLPTHRKMSFKRRPSSMAQKSNFIQRASMGVFPGFKLPIAASESGSHLKRFRRTASAHQGNSNGPLDHDSLFAQDGVPTIPRMLPTGKSDPYSTPIPTLPFVVLCLVCFGEFSSAGVAGPFLFFMIDDFGVGGESEVGFWAGIVASSFFFAQFLTSLMWASVANKRGRRWVLMISLLGNAASTFLFGTCKSLPSAIMIRFMQGFFNGAVGVAKGAIRDITDETNEGRAYALMGFCWGMGGIIGPILGGLLEHPVRKYPGLFANYEFLSDNPYVLPCMIASCFTGVGAILTLFIGYDGGPRTGAIQLPEKADIERATTQVANNVGSLGRSASKRIGSYFSSGNKNASDSALSLSRTNTQTGEPSTPTTGIQNSDFLSTEQIDLETGGPPSPARSEGTIVTHTNLNDSTFSRIDSMYRPRLFSRTEERQRNILGGGSAYGYDRRMSRTSAAGPPGVPRVNSFAYDRNARMSFSSTNQYAPDFEDIGNRPGLSFAQRFLLAQDDAVFSISGLWVAAAINSEDTFEDVFEDEEADELLEDDAVDDADFSLTEESLESDSVDEEDQRASHEGSPLLAPKHLPPLNFAQRKLSRSTALSEAGHSSSPSRPRSFRRPSSARIPSLYTNIGIENPVLVSNANPLKFGGSGLASGAPNTRPESTWDPTLAGIPENNSNRNSLSALSNKIRSRSPSAGASPARKISMTASPSARATEALPQSLFTLLPAAVIAHYGVMAFHSSTFDQVFMAFLVTPEPSGGLGLTASHYAQLIAAMAFCQMMFQFVFYPKVGPPQGKLSHLAMLRLGTLIYLPCYTLFPLLRGMLHPETDGFVMTGMIFFASLRWLANICAFTAVTVLINAMTPPHLTPLANGLAQTTSSAARFVGPILGGLIWAKGIEGGPDAHSWPFNYHLGFWFVGLVAFTGFLFTWRIK